MSLLGASPTAFAANGPRCRWVRPRRAAAIVACFSLQAAVAAAQIAAPSPPAGSLFFYPERFALEDGSLAEAERGLLFVPVNRSDPDSEVIGVELYRFSAQEGVAADMPPIFLLNGGPGFEGLAPELAEPGFYEREIAQLVAIAPLVVVGQRGIGSSKPSTICAQAPFPPVLSKNCREYWESKGLDLRGFNVVEAAADVRDVARALGYPKIIVSGGSFGSHWGMAVMRYHPEIVARALLTGMEGPDHTYDMPSGVLSSLERMANAAERSQRLQGQIPEGGLLAGFREVLERLSKRPAKVTVEDPKSGESREMTFNIAQVRGMALGYTSRVSSRRGMPSWPADLIALYRGDFSRAARLRLEDDGDGGRRRYRTASYFLLDCGSGISAERLEELQSDPAIAVVGNLGQFYQMSCPPWETDLGERFRSGFDTEIPTAIVHGTWDVNTPYENALELVPRFKNGKLVTIDGGSHGALGEALRHSETFATALMHFLRTGDLAQLPERVELPEIEWEVPEG